jgi:hypothetical protein
MATQNYLFNFSNKNSIQINNPLTLYYCIFNSDGTFNGTETIFKTDPDDLITYRGIGNRYMTDSDFNPNTDIITYVSSRTLANPPDFPKEMYNEVLTITSQPYNENLVQAVCNYEDTGSSFETTVLFNNFKIIGASGKFLGYKNIKITYNNDNIQKTRTMEFS